MKRLSAIVSRVAWRFSHVSLCFIAAGGLALAQVPGVSLTSAMVTTALGFTPPSRALTSAHVYVGNGSNIATDAALTGDVSLTNAGASTVIAVSALAKVAASGTGPGASALKLEVVAGTNGGSCKLQAYAGTSGTAVVIIDNVGSGC